MEKLFSAILYMKRKFAEPSSHAALASVCQLAGINLDTGIIHDVVVVLSIGFGGAAFFLNEQKPLTQVD